MLRDITKLQLPIGLIQNLKDFEEKFLNTEYNNNITLIFFFEDFHSAYRNLLKFHNVLVRNNEIIDFFYFVGDEIDSSFYREQYQLKKPFFVIFQAKNTFLEMRLNISEDSFEEILDKIPKDHESSLEESSFRSINEVEFINNEENYESHKAIYDEFLNNLLSSKNINEQQFYFLKYLFSENNAELLENIISSLR